MPIKSKSLIKIKNVIFDYFFEIKISKNDKDDNLLWGDDDDSVPFVENLIPFDMDNSTVTTENLSVDNSAGNASIDESIEVYLMHQDEIGFHYHGPKVFLINETPVTICSANTIGCIESRKLVRVLLDSGSTGCLIKRSALPKDVVPKELTNNKKKITH